LLFTHPSFTEHQQANKVITEQIPLLVLGETGVGKEQFVKKLHAQSSRRAQPLVAVNCAALPAELVESELFGYQAGAFTGANRTGFIGKIRQAHGGFLFLDEIGEMPLAAQSRLLRVLQEREVVPVGSNQSVKVDIQIIAATHMDLESLVSQGLFRQDLFYRLNGLQVRLPALRERQDIRLLTRRLLPGVHGPSRARPLLGNYRREMRVAPVEEEAARFWIFHHMMGQKPLFLQHEEQARGVCGLVKAVHLSVDARHLRWRARCIGLPAE
ncbi:MAG: sigma-54 factor interaction domain-containing protein, partial [Serratia marcescens]|nr:sigma-54 factor interaction domain-containing protein [Serratia marcescens]